MNYPYSDFMKNTVAKITAHSSRPDEIRALADAKQDGYGNDTEGRIYPAMFGGLSGACSTLRYDISTLTLESFADGVRRLERIVSALESIGVNLDEEDIVALEGIARNYGEPNRDDLRDALNTATTEWREEQRENEQAHAIEALIAAGFALDDLDGETWTRGDLRVTIECVHPAESMYRWEAAGCAQNQYAYIDSGKSGDFHRLIHLIGAEVKA